MIAARQWTVRKRQKIQVYQPRYHHDYVGKLIQIDGSHHDWFEGRSEKCCLLIFIDDATSQLISLYSCEPENTFDDMKATRKYVENPGEVVNHKR
ncbi:hypothetical protein [Shewanella psychrophila]|uniref:hypothetical protein n=1 Tax=Shewanella psychrophila TaxID=225848 RepID=UPI00098A8E98|nr:hypothetical protein [Shewanella psychrophila]